MLNHLMNFVLLILSICCSFYSYKYLSNEIQFSVIFIAVILFGVFLMNLKMIVKNKKIDSYKRQLEKESISCDNSTAKVKVLESKIEVLEKALENALNKK